MKKTPKKKSEIVRGYNAIADVPSNKHAVALGRKGGLKRGEMSARRRSELARKAVLVRWARWREKKLREQAQQERHAQEFAQGF